jgi:hypothetical protein
MSQVNFLTGNLEIDNCLTKEAEELMLDRVYGTVKSYLWCFQNLKFRVDRDDIKLDLSESDAEKSELLKEEAFV